jgi:hypothetical protein
MLQNEEVYLMLLQVPCRWRRMDLESEKEDMRG